MNLKVHFQNFISKNLIRFRKKILRIKKKFGLNNDSDYLSLSKRYRNSPIEIHAFIRVKNEIATIESCLKSIEGIITKGIIGYNKLDDEIDDGTEEVILKFCERNKGFKAVRYPYNVVPANDIRYKEYQKIPKEERIDTYYNEVFKHIPVGAWFMKIDCDHIFDREKLKNLAYLPKNDNDAIVLARMNFHYENEKLYVVNVHTVAANSEWVLMKKTNKQKHYLTTGLRGGVNNSFYAYESLKEKENEYILKFKNIYYTDLFNYHFPFLKTSRTLDKSFFTLFDDYYISEEIKKKFHISDDMLDKNKILNICKNLKIK